MPRQYSVLFISLFAVLYLTGAALTAQGAMQANGAQGANTENAGRPADIAAADPAPVKLRLDTPSGLPVPRLVSLKAQKTFCRSGPSFSHPVRLTFMRAGLPVMIIAETKDHWRKIRDVEGDECWTHKSKLSGEKTALVLEDGLALRTKPDAAAPARARLGRGVIARVEGDKDGWLKVTADGRKGWARASAFWGAEAEAPLSGVVYP